MNIADEHLKNLFVNSMEENLDLIDDGLIKLEDNVDDKELINSIMRAAHSLKGSSSLVGFTKLKDIMHAIESVMVDINNQKTRVSRPLVSLLLEGIDRVKLLKEQFFEGTITVEVSDLIEKLETARLQEINNDPQKTISTDGQNISDNNKEEITEVTIITAQELELIELDNDMIAMFVSELEEDIEKIDNGLMELENNGEDTDLINGIMRAAHNIKGSSGMVGFTSMKELTHAVESVMVDINAKKIEVNRTIISLLLESIDRIKLLKEQFVEKNINSEVSDLVEKLTKVREQDSGVKEKTPTVASNMANNQKQNAPTKVKLENVQNVKIKVKAVESMVNQISDLIIYQSQLVEINKTLKRQYMKEKRFKETLEILENVGRDIRILQDELMQSTMMSMEIVFRNFPRMVRDLETSLNKNMSLIIENADTKLDKSIAEEISNPLIHIIRNSADHGIESPEERRKAGKPEKGTIKLSAWQKSEQIIISIEDDGKGIDEEKVLNSAIKKGLISSEEAKKYTKQEAINLVFHPGFSTAEKVSDISGRGVGMDVVKTHIEKINGTIELKSEKGKGTKIILKIPSTMSIIPCIVTKINNKMICLPSINVNKVLSITPEDIQDREAKEFIISDDISIPLVRLHSKFGGNPKDFRGNFYVVIIGLVEKRIAILVDRLLGSQKIVVKSLGEYLGKVTNVAGATILENGRVGVVLDIADVVSSNSLS